MPSGWSAVGAAENDVGHFPSSQGLGRLLAEHPANGIENVRLTAAVWSYDRSDPAMKVQNRPQRKRLKPDHFEGLKIHEESFSLPWADVYGARRDVMASKNTTYCGCRSGLLNLLKW